MPIGLADFAKMPDSFKFIIFIAILMGMAIPINAFGIEFVIGDIFFIPISFALSTISNGVIQITFQMFFVLVMVVLLYMFTMKVCGFKVGS